MKSFLLLFTLFIFSITTTNSKDFWEIVNVPNETEIKDISFSPSGDIYTCYIGMFKSTDSGNSWNDVSTLDDSHYHIILSTFTFDTYFQSIYAINDSIIFTSMNDGYIFKSINGGASWQRMDSTLKNIHTFLRFGDRIFANKAYDLYYTDNFGKNWSRFTPWDSTNSGSSLIERMAISPDGKLFAINKGVWVIDPLTLQVISYSQLPDSPTVRCFAFNNGKVFAGTYNNSIYMSTDGGYSWTALVNSPINISNMVITETGRIIAGANNKIYYSADNENSWLLAENFNTNDLINDIEFYNNVIYVCGSTGLYKSTDNGETWQKHPVNPGYPKIESFDEDENSNVYIKTRRSIYKSSGNLKNWTKFDENIYLQLFDDLVAANNGRIFVDGYPNSWVSDDSGHTWKSISEVFDTTKTINIIKNSLGWIYASLHGKSYYLYVSKDNGYSWDSLKTFDVYFEFKFTIGSKDNNIIITYKDYNNYNHIKYSKDYGLTWDSLKCTGSYFSYNLIESIDIFDNEIIVGTSDHDIVKSTNNGLTWNYCGGSSIQHNIGYFGSNTFNQLKNIAGTNYVLAQTGIYLLDSIHDKFQLDNSGIIPSSTYSMKLLKDKHIYVNTITGMYRSVDKITDVDEPINMDGIKITVIPNPISNIGTISVSSDFKSNLKLALYDISGNIINIIYDNSMNPGNTDLVFDATKLTTGQYFLRVETGKESKTVVVKIMK